MIITMLLERIYEIFGFLISFINIPDMPTEAMEYVASFFSYLTTGASILANYTPYSYIMTLFGVILAVDIGIKVYHFVMWVLKKIPMLGIE